MDRPRCVHVDVSYHHTDLHHGTIDLTGHLVGPCHTPIISFSANP